MEGMGPEEGMGPLEGVGPVEDVLDADQDARMDPQSEACHGEASGWGYDEVGDEACDEVGGAAEEIHGGTPDAYPARLALGGRTAAEEMGFRSHEILESHVVGEA